MKRPLQENDIVWVDYGKFNMALKYCRLARIVTTQEELDCPIFDKSKGIQIKYIDTPEFCWVDPIHLIRVPPLVALALQSE